MRALPGHAPIEKIAPVMELGRVQLELAVTAGKTI